LLAPNPMLRNTLSREALLAATHSALENLTMLREILQGYLSVRDFRKTLFLSLSCSQAPAWEHNITRCPAHNKSISFQYYQAGAW